MGKRRISTISIVLLVIAIIFYLLFFYLPTSGFYKEGTFYFSELFNNDNISSRKETETDEYIYIVQQGDTLESIAASYAISSDYILLANNIDSSQDLVVGMELKIPPANGIFYTVKDGDKIESIAEEYDINVQSIADFNWLDYPYQLEEGEEIFLPM